MRRALLTTVAAAIIAFSSGCAGDGAAKKRVDALRDEITKLQGEQDMLHDRLAALETRVGTAEARASRGGDEDRDDRGLVERPRLKVVRLNPGAAPPEAAPPPSAEPEETSEDEPRPVLRLRGDEEPVLGSHEPKNGSRSKPRPARKPGGAKEGS